MYNKNRFLKTFKKKSFYDLKRSKNFFNTRVVVNSLFFRVGKVYICTHLIYRGKE